MDIVTEIYRTESESNQIELEWESNQIVFEWELIFKAAQGLSLISPFSSAFCAHLLQNDEAMQKSHFGETIIPLIHYVIATLSFSLSSTHLFFPDCRLSLWLTER